MGYNLSYSIRKASNINVLCFLFLKKRCLILVVAIFLIDVLIVFFVCLFLSLDIKKI